MARKGSTPANVTRMRNAIVAVVAVIVVAIVGFGLWYTSDTAVPDTFVEGTHYEAIDGAAAVDPRRPIVVREYFSYYCVHCRNFDSQVEAWLERKPADVEFERSPVVFSPAWRLIGQAYYALAAKNALAENHPRLFRAIHDNNRQFTSADMMADFVDGHGIDRATFLAALNSPDVLRRINEADARARDQRINAVPSLVVADRYVVNMDEVPRDKAFAVVDHIVAEIRATK
jgi:thiol:disulfide interchange protein DsbA